MLLREMQFIRMWTCSRAWDQPEGEFSKQAIRYPQALSFQTQPGLLPRAARLTPDICLSILWVLDSAAKGPVLGRERHQ